MVRYTQIGTVLSLFPFIKKYLKARVEPPSYWPALQTRKPFLTEQVC